MVVYCTQDGVAVSTIEIFLMEISTDNLLINKRFMYEKYLKLNRL